MSALEVFGNAVKRSVRFWHDSGLGAKSEALDQAVRAMSFALREADMTLASKSLVVDLEHSGPPNLPPMP